MLLRLYFSFNFMLVFICVCVFTYCLLYLCAIDVLDFVETTGRLLSLERQAEIDENEDLKRGCSISELEKRGVCISRLAIVSQSTGMFGRAMLVFESTRGNPGQRCLPASKFSPGDIVGLYVGGKDLGLEKSMVTSGVITRVTETRLTVAFEDLVEEQQSLVDGQIILMQLANDVTFQRLKM